MRNVIGLSALRSFRSLVVTAAVGAGILASAGAARGQLVTGDFSNSFAGGAYNVGGNTYNGLILFGLPLGGSAFQGGSSAIMVRQPASGTQFSSFRVNSSAFGGSDPSTPHAVTQYGNFRFTANNSITTYSITGNSGFQISGGVFGGVSINIALTEVVSGNILAQWSSGVGASNFTGVLFDGSAPAQLGSWTGLLSAGVQYDFTWTYTLTIGQAPVNQSLVSIAPTPGNTTNWLQIQFLPTPGATALLALGGCVAVRRRRRA